MKDYDKSSLMNFINNNNLKTDNDFKITYSIWYFYSYHFTPPKI